MSLQCDPKQKSTWPNQVFNVCFSNIKVCVIIILAFFTYSSSYFKWPSLLLQNLRMLTLWEGIELHFFSNWKHGGGNISRVSLLPISNLDRSMNPAHQSVSSVITWPKLIAWRKRIADTWEISPFAKEGNRWQEAVLGFWSHWQDWNYAEPGRSVSWIIQCLDISLWCQYSFWRWGKAGPGIWGEVWKVGWLGMPVGRIVWHWWLTTQRGHPSSPMWKSSYQKLFRINCDQWYQVKLQFFLTYKFVRG